MIKTDQVIHGDSLDFMRTLPDNCIDLVLTDPPYGLWVDKILHKKAGTQYWKSKAKKSNYWATDWDSVIPSKEYFDEIKRISKHAIIWGWNYFIEHLENSPCWIVWDKNNGDNNFADCELAWTNFSTAVRMKKYTWAGMLQENMKNKEVREHPTQKPKDLFKWVLENYSEPWDIILDCFAGSWTTAVACIETGRKYIVIDQEKKYIDITNKRIWNTTLPLFIVK